MARNRRPKRRDADRDFAEVVQHILKNDNTHCGSSAWQSTVKRLAEIVIKLVGERDDLKHTLIERINHDGLLTMGQSHYQFLASANLLIDELKEKQHA